MIAALEQRDHAVLWHPCSQMKEYETFKPLPVISAQGAYLTLADGSKIIDAIASWWCKSLGHCEPRLQAALLQQMNQFEHVILANTTNDVIVELSEKLTQLTRMDKVFYASDGSSAIEIAMKMSLHSRQLTGQKQRRQFANLANAYHGETFGAISVSNMEMYCHPYQHMLQEAVTIAPLSYINNKRHPLWENCQSDWEKIENYLAPYENQLTAVIVEPILQAASGMKIYSKDFLFRLRQWTEKNNIHLIADEIMTGIGRTGKMFAYEYADIQPDFICLAKGLTSGMLPMSAVLLRDEIYDIFYHDEKRNSFLHSHTQAGNALAASVALQVLEIIQREQLVMRANYLEKIMRGHMHDIAQRTQKLHQIRSIGAVVAADLLVQDASQNIGYEVYQCAVKRGALLRPLGNTIYWTPPLNISEETLFELKEITQRALLDVSF